MKTKNMTTSQLRSGQCPLIRVHYVCGVALILGLALGLNVAAQSRIVIEKPIIKLGLKFPDLWIPSGKYCVFNLPTYDTTAGILSVPVGNAGSGSAPSSSLRVKEYRGEEGALDGPWTFHKDWWATVPGLTPGQQVAIQVQVAKWSGGFTEGGKPIKHPRRWIIKADGNDKILEINENNNGFIYLTLN